MSPSQKRERYINRFIVAKIGTDLDQKKLTLTPARGKIRYILTSNHWRMYYEDHMYLHPRVYVGLE
jgi:hypothetical protein